MWILGPTLRNGQPRYPAELRALERIEEIAGEEDVAFLHLNELAHPELDEPVFFRDNSHLNRTGARFFAKIFVRETEAHFPELAPEKIAPKPVSSP